MGTVVTLKLIHNLSPKHILVLISIFISTIPNPQILIEPY